VIITVSKNNIQVEVIDLSDYIVNGGETVFLIGRSQSCHIALDDKKISREQVELSYNGASWTVRPLSSYSTTLLNSMPIHKQENISTGDIIGIEQFKLQVEVDESIDMTSIMPGTIPAPPPATAQEQNDQMIDEEIPVQEDLLDEAKVEVQGEAQDVSVPVDDMTDDFQVEGTADAGGDETSDFAEESDFGSDEGFGEEGDFAQEQEYQQEGEEGYSEDFQEGEYPEDEYGDYGEGDYAVDDYGGDADDGTKVVSGFAKFSLELFGEHAPYDTYNVQNGETFIGRDADKCQIVLQDPEVSSIHAVIKKNMISCVLEDLQSANGTILNGKRINSKEILNGDEFIIGGTTFTVHVGNEFIDAQSESLMPVAENQVMEVEEIVEVDEDSEDFDEADFPEEQGDMKTPLFSKATWQDPEKRKKLIYGAVILMGLWTMLDDGKPAQVKKKAPTKKEQVAKDDKAKKAKEIKLTPEQAEQAEAQYVLGKEFLTEGKYPEAIDEFEKLFTIKKDYKNGQQLYQLAKEKLKELEDIERKKREEQAAEEKRLKIKGLVEKAEKATADKNIPVAKSLFQKIRQIDPDNYDVTNLELEIQDYEKKKRQEELEKAQKIAERKRMVSDLTPGKTAYLKENWFQAIGLLEKYLNRKETDEDLLKEAAEMLKESKQKLNDKVSPLLGKARSLREGEDLKGAYAAYADVLQVDPTLTEATIEMQEINETLTKRARVAYREAIVSESLGLFEEARQKFREVQQIAPADNEYYKKATSKLSEL
jgi:pSer/pThr/pTyr-binding forkhead associated (FHA) protein